MYIHMGLLFLHIENSSLCVVLNPLDSALSAGELLDHWTRLSPPHHPGLCYVSAFPTLSRYAADVCFSFPITPVQLVFYLLFLSLASASPKGLGLHMLPNPVPLTPGGVGTLETCSLY